MDWLGQMIGLPPEFLHRSPLISPYLIKRPTHEIRMFRNSMSNKAFLAHGKQLFIDFNLNPSRKTCQLGFFVNDPNIIFFISKSIIKRVLTLDVAQFPIIKHVVRI